MADVTIISPDGRRALIDESELDAAVAQGFKPAPPEMGASHVPGGEIPKRNVPIWETVARALGSPYEAAAGRGKFILSPVTGAMIPVDPEFERRFADEEEMAREAAEAHPLVDFAAGMASPEGIATSVATSGMGGGIVRGISNKLKKKFMPEAVSKVQQMIMKDLAGGAKTELGSAMGLAEDAAEEAAKKRLGLGFAARAAAPVAGMTAGEAVGQASGLPYGGAIGMYAGGLLGGGSTAPVSAPARNVVNMIRDPALRAAITKLLMNHVTGAAAGSELDNLLREVE